MDEYIPQQAGLSNRYESISALKFSCAGVINNRFDPLPGKDTIVNADGKNMLVDDDPKSHSRQLLFRSTALKPAVSKQAYLNSLKVFLTDMACQNPGFAKGIVQFRVVSDAVENCQDAKIIALAMQKRIKHNGNQCPSLSELDARLLKKLENIADKQCNSRD